MSTPETPRPQPQYGQYASPEEQQARMGTPAQAPAAVPIPAPPQVSQTEATTRSPLRTVDRMATIALLVFGALSVFQSVPVMTDTSNLLSALDVTVSLADPAAGRIAGIIAAAVLILGWAGTALLSWRLLSRGIVTFWVPLVAGVVFNVVASLIVLIPLMSDTAVWNALQTSLLGG